jgi:hypothetical protein
VGWEEHAQREIQRYRDGDTRLGDEADLDSRQRQLTRMGNAAGGAGLALLVLGRDAEARPLADSLRTHDGFPHDVGDALATIAAHDRVGYVEAVESVLESFETRDEYLEDIPVADTVVVLQGLAAPRDLAAELASPLLP